MDQVIDQATTGITSDASVANNLFERATRLKLRFTTEYGMVSVEDLWDLPLATTRPRTTSLDDVAKALRRELRDTEEESFVVAAKKGDDRLALSFEVVKHIIAVRLAEAEAAKTARQRAEKKQQLLGVLARKQDAALENMTEAEIKAAIEEL